MSQYDKMVKMACKPKNAPPKPKYVDPLVSATFSDDGSLQDITRSLSLRLREPNAVVVFKALLVLHMMIRTGNTENLLQTLSSGSGDPLRLRNVADSFAGQNQGQPFEGYAAPTNMGMYAMYLDVRIKCFKDLKHDYVRTQTESNRRSDGLGANSKARRLRHLAVEKGLLREVKTIQRMLDALVVCRFYEDNLQDENTIIAFRMLIKDLLVLFQAGNEGVSNILEHYFEMSKSDATEAFSIYKSFIKQTDRVVDYLGMARKLHNVVNIPVPNLKHAPTGLVKALEEYLNDPDFENNRVEYRKSLGVVEGRPGREPSPNKAESKQEDRVKTQILIIPDTSSTPSKPTPAPAASSSTASAPPAAVPSSAPQHSAPPGANQKIQDFFDSIQTDQQPTMFGGPASNPPFMQQQQPQFPFMQQPSPQQAFNPFRQSMMMPQQTGFMPPQMTGFQMPNQTGMGMGMGMMQPQMTGQMAFGQQSQPFPPQQQQQQQQAFIQPQPIMAPQQTGFLQPQQTGTSNPFRQSMMMPSPTGGAMPFTQPNSPFGNANPNVGGNIQRPGSTPASFPLTQNQQQQKPLTAQPTGSKNPFAPAGGSQPVMAGQGKERGLSMNEMAMNRFNQAQGQMQGQGQEQGQGQMGGLNGNSTRQGNGAGYGSGMADIASAFAFDQKPTSPSTNSGNDFLSQFGSLSVNTSSTGTSSAFGNSNTFSGFGTNTNTSPSSNPTSPSGTVSSSGGFLQPQKTGYGGSSIKPFKPSSSFGSQLMADLGSVPEDTTGNQGGAGAMSPGTTGGNTGGMFGNSSQQNSASQGQNQFGQLSPQMTGSNPFRQSMFGSLGAQPTGMPPGGMGGMGGAFGAGSPFAGQNQTLNQPGGGAFGQGQGHGQGMGNGMGMGMGQGQQQGGSLI